MTYATRTWSEAEIVQEREYMRLYLIRQDIAVVLFNRVMPRASVVKELKGAAVLCDMLISTDMLGQDTLLADLQSTGADLTDNEWNALESAVLSTARMWIELQF